MKERYTLSLPHPFCLPPVKKAEYYIYILSANKKSKTRADNETRGYI